MKPENQIDPEHDEKRGIVRILGAAFLVAGAVFMLIGVANFFMAFGGHGFPRYFWCCFVGMPLLWLGSVLCGVGFIGAVARFVAGESAPVAKDATNYMAEETKGAVKTVAAAVGEGLAAGAANATKPIPTLCPQCQQPNDSDAQFCKSCGATLPKTKTCPTCHAGNKPGAKFCDQCGHALG